MNTLIDALKGLREAMLAHDHTDSHDTADYCRGFDDGGKGWAGELSKIIAEHERSAEPALVRNDLQTNLGRIAADIQGCMRQINPNHEVHAVLNGCRLAILVNRDKAKDWQTLPKGPQS